MRLEIDESNLMHTASSFDIYHAKPSLHLGFFSIVEKLYQAK